MSPDSLPAESPGSPPPRGHEPPFVAWVLGLPRRYPVAVTAIASCYLLTLALGYAFGHALQAVGYALATLVGVMLVRLLAPAAAHEPLDRPAREATTLLSFTAVGFIAMCVLHAQRFGFAPVAGIGRLVLFAVVVIFMFPVANTIYLWRRGSRIDGQGLRPRRLWIALVLVAVVATGAVVFAQPALQRTFGKFRDEITAGLAASVALQVLAEELQRYQVQSRLAAALRSPPAAVLLAALLWGALHVPAYYEGDPVKAALGVFTFVPLGLLWGYASYRTASIWPSVLAHACNVWGLQAF